LRLSKGERRRSAIEITDVILSLSKGGRRRREFGDAPREEIITSP
jgi:hypothetical protein